MTKQLAIVPAGGGEVKEVTIGPGTTVQDVKRYTQLEKFLLSRPGSADYFADCEVLYPVVADGDKLVATFLTKVGSLQGPTVLALILAIAILIGLLRRLISEVRSWKPGQSTAATGQTQLATATFEPAWVPHPAPVVVTPDTRPYWVQKGWRCEGNDYHGYYRTRFGSWQGFIAARSPSLTTAYIYDPPPALLQGPHSLCFSDAGDGWWKIHFSVGTSDVSSTIVAIEKVIEEAFLCATTR
jgi:hypothetical protein